MLPLNKIGSFWPQKAFENDANKQHFYEERSQFEFVQQAAVQENGSFPFLIRLSAWSIHTSVSSLCRACLSYSWPSPSLHFSLSLCKWISQQLNKYLPTRTLNMFAPRRANNAASGGFVRICIKQTFAAALARWFKEFEGATGLSWGSCSPSNTDRSEKSDGRLFHLLSSERAEPRL